MELSTLFFSLSSYPVTIFPRVDNILFGKNNLSAHDSLDISSWMGKQEVSFHIWMKTDKQLFFCNVHISLQSSKKFMVQAYYDSGSIQHID